MFKFSICSAAHVSILHTHTNARGAAGTLCGLRRRRAARFAALALRRTTAPGRGRGSRAEVGGDRILREPKFRAALTSSRIPGPCGVAQALSTARGKEVQGRSLRTPILFVDRSIAPRNFRAQATIAFRFASLSS